MKEHFFLYKTKFYKLRITFLQSPVKPSINDFFFFFVEIATFTATCKIRELRACECVRDTPKSLNDSRTFLLARSVSAGSGQ